MGSRFVQVTFRFRDQLSQGMEAASKKINGVSDKLQAQYSKVGKLGKEWSKAGKSMQKVGEGLTKRVTLPIVAAGTAAGKLYMDFDKSMAQINTLLDDDSHLQGYEDAVLAVSGKLGIEARTSAEGMYQTISVLGDHGETTQKTFGIMAEAAKAGGADVVDSVNMIATAMNGYGEVSDETAQRISDLSFKAVKLGKTSFPELANSMSPLFPLASNLGISYEELYATMSTATTSFAGNTAEASTQIKGLMTGFIKPTEDMQKLIAKAGYSSGAAMIKSEGLAGALKIVQKEAGSDGMSKYFGNIRGLTAALGLSGSGMEKFEKHLAEMQNATGATGDALAKMGDTDAAKFHKALVRVQNAGIKFGKAVLPAITPLVEKLGNAVSKAAEWFGNLSEGQQQMVVKSLAIAAAAGPVISLLGKGASAVGGVMGTVSKFGKALDSTGKISGALIKTFPVGGRLLTGFGKGFSLFGKLAQSGAKIGATAFKGLGTVFGTVGKFFLSNPILLVIAAIAAGAVLIWKNWDKVKKHLEPVFKLFKSAKKHFDEFKKAASEKLAAVGEKFSQLKEKAAGLKDSIASKFNSIKEKFGSLKEKASDLRSGIASRFDAMKSKVGSFKDKVSDMKSGAAAKFDSLKEKVGNFRAGAAAAMQNAGKALASFAVSCLSSTSGAKGYIGGMLNFVTGTFTGNWKQAWRGVVQAFGSIFGGIRSKAASALEGIKGLVSSGASKIQGLLSKLGSLRSSAGKGINISGPSVGHNASGTNNWKGGLTYVNEKGGEIINLPRHSQVIPHDVSMEMARSAGSSRSTTVNISKLADKFVVREESDIDKIAQAIVEKLEMLQGDVVYD